MVKNAEQYMSKEDYFQHVIARAKHLVKELSDGWDELRGVEIVKDDVYVAFGYTGSQIVRVEKSKLIDETDLLSFAKKDEHTSIPTEDVVRIKRDNRIDCYITCRDNNYTKCYQLKDKKSFICTSLNDLKFLEEYNQGIEEEPKVNKEVFIPDDTNYIEKDETIKDIVLSPELEAERIIQILKKSNIETENISEDFKNVLRKALKEFKETGFILPETYENIWNENRHYVGIFANAKAFPIIVERLIK